MVKRTAQMGCIPINMKDLYRLIATSSQHFYRGSRRQNYGYLHTLPDVANGRYCEGHGEEDWCYLVGSVDKQTAGYCKTSEKKDERGSNFSRKLTWIAVRHVVWSFSHFCSRRYTVLGPGQSEHDDLLPHKAHAEAFI
jgi:hypothetical protein